MRLVVHASCFIVSLLVGICAYYVTLPLPPPVGSRFGFDSHPKLSSSPVRPVTRIDEIVAGQSVGHLFLGDGRERAVELFGRLDSEYDYNINTTLNCGWNKKELRFWEIENKSSPFHYSYGNGAWVYLRDDEVIQIKIQSERFVTSDGIDLDSSPSKIRKQYPNSEAYVELNSQRDYSGGQNLIYWIDESKGIASEFQYHKAKRKKVLAYVYIFERYSGFLPNGCVFLETQGWVKLPLFALTEPASMQSDWESGRLKAVSKSPSTASGLHSLR